MGQGRVVKIDERLDSAASLVGVKKSLEGH